MNAPTIFAVAAASALAIAAQAEVNVVPYPASVVEKPGSFTCSPAQDLAKVVKFSRNASIPREGYRLSVTPSGIRVAASDKAGAFYALQTLEQLRDATTASIPCVEIKDAPRFTWRGVHVDDVRHFLGKEQAKRTIDQVAKFKFNVFHWHLTDNEAWRIEVPGYPQLTATGAFYTKDDIREVVEYAAERHIKVVPEVDFPGHFRRLSNTYPEFSCTTDNPHDKGRAPMCVGNPDAVKFVEAALDAVCDLFPESDIIHIGGDECHQGIWTKCEKCKALMAREGLAKPHDLQAWITRHAVNHLAAKGRRAIGWDEMLDAKAGYLPTSAMGMRWHDKGAERTARAAAAGHEIVNCHKRFCYFDYPQGLEGDKLPYFGRGRPYEIVTIEKVYSFDPLAELPVESRAKVIGGQCNNWTERTRNGKELEWKLWPRALALAEVLWTYPDPKKRDFEGFKRRAEVRLEALVASGVNASPMPTADMLATAGPWSVNMRWKGGSGGSEVQPLDLYTADNWSNNQLPSKSHHYMLAVDSPTVLTNSAPAGAIIADWFSPYSGDFTFLGAMRVQVFGWTSPSGRATVTKKGDWAVGYEFDLAHEDNSSLVFTNVSGNVTKIRSETDLRIGAGVNATALVENLSGDWIVSANVVLGCGAGSRGAFRLGGGSLAARSVSAKDGTGILAFNGGILKAGDSGALIAPSANLTVTVGTKGGTIDTNGKNVTIEQEIVGVGKLLVTGGGTATFTVAPKCKIEATPGTTITVL